MSGIDPEYRRIYERQLRQSVSKRWFCEPCGRYHFGSCPLEDAGGDQPRLFDVRTGEALRDEAMEKAKENADADWYDAALRCVERAAHDMDYFTTDDVWRQGLRKPREPRALGPVMTEAMKRGWIVPLSSHEKSKRPEAHASPKRVWRSLVR